MEDKSLIPYATVALSDDRIENVVLYAAIPRAVLGTALFETILSQAPDEIQTREEQGALHLENGSIRMFYSDGRGDLGLIFHTVFPNFSYGSNRLSHNQFSNEALKCEDIGLLGQFSLPQTRPGGMGLITSSIHISKPNEELRTYAIPGQQDWYDQGTELLRMAAEKYDLENIIRRRGQKKLGSGPFTKLLSK